MAAAVPVIMMAAAVAGTAVSVYSSVQQGKAQSAAREREASQLARSAAQARTAAAQKAEDAAKEHRRILATQRARYGASGLEFTGSPLLVQIESMREGEEQLRRIIEEGEMGYTSSMESSSEARIQAGQAMTSGYVNAAGGAIKGAAGMERIYRNYWMDK